MLASSKFTQAQLGNSVAQLHHETGCAETLNTHFRLGTVETTNRVKLRGSRHPFLVYHDDERRPAGYGVEQQALRLAHIQHNLSTSHIPSLC